MNKLSPIPNPQFNAASLKRGNIVGITHGNNVVEYYLCAETEDRKFSLVSLESGHRWNEKPMTMPELKLAMDSDVDGGIYKKIEIVQRRFILDSREGLQGQRGQIKG